MNAYTRYGDRFCRKQHEAAIRASYQKYKFTLSQLANRYHTSVDEVYRMCVTVYLPPNAPRRSHKTDKEIARNMHPDPLHFFKETDNILECHKI